MAMFDCAHCGDRHHVNDFCATGPMSAEPVPPTPRETADHIGEANEKVSDHIGDATTMIACAELARLAEDTKGAIYFGDIRGRAMDKFKRACTPDTILALLSEIAALRGEVERWHSAYEIAHDQATANGSAARQAERQRDELRKAMPDLSSVIAWLDNGCEPKHAVTELAIYKARIDQAPANQGADQ